MMPDNHSKVVGGSNAHRVLSCPGSIDQVALAPPSESSVYAAEGTALHSAMEYLTDPKAKRTYDDLRGVSFNGHTLVGYSDDPAQPGTVLADAVVPAHKYFLKVISIKDEYHLEVMAEFPGIPGAYGTSDVVQVQGDTLVIFDYKFGAGVPVHAKGNAQLQFYACAVLSKFDLWRTVKHVQMIICQPRIEDGNSDWTVPVSVLRAFRHSLIRAVNGPRTLATGPHCKWCDAAPFCPARKAANAATLKWRAAGPDIAKAMKMIPELKAWISDVESAAYASLHAGGVVEGYKLVEKRATRKWALDDTEIRRYLASYGLKRDQFAPRKTVTPKQAEDLLKPLGEKLEGDKVSKESSGYTVAPESSKAPAVSTGRDLSELASFIK